MNPLIEEVRAARAARAKSLDDDPHKIAEWARAAHAERQQKLKESKNSNSTADALRAQSASEASAVTQQ